MYFPDFGSSLGEIISLGLRVDRQIRVCMGNAVSSPGGRVWAAPQPQTDFSDFHGQFYAICTKQIEQFVIIIMCWCFIYILNSGRLIVYICHEIDMSSRESSISVQAEATYISPSTVMYYADIDNNYSANP